jgi:ATP/maltotriose-dependent transcriptional regulator MalT
MNVEENNLTLISAPAGFGKTTLLNERECVEYLVT